MRTENQPTAVYRLAADSDGSFSYPTFPTSGDSKVFVLSYRCSLEVFGIEPGIELIDETAPRPENLKLPPPDSVVSTEISGGEAMPWRELEPLDSEILDILSRLDIPHSVMCDLYGQSYTLNVIPGAYGDTWPNGRARYILPIGEERWLEGIVLETEDPKDFQFNLRTVSTKEGTTEESEIVEPEAQLADGTPVPLPRDGAVEIDGELWFADRDGRVAHGRYGSPFIVEEIESEVIPKRNTFSLTGGKTSSGIELISAETGLVERFDGTQWTPIRRATPDPQALFQTEPQMVWLGPGQAIGVQVSDFDHRVALMDGASFDWLDLGHAEPPLDPDLLELPLAVAATDELGPVVGSGYSRTFNPIGGYLFVLDDGQLVRIPNSRFDFVVRAVGELGDGSYIVSGYGELQNFQSYHPFAGVCQQGKIDTDGDDSASFLLPMGPDRVLAVGFKGSLFNLIREGQANSCAPIPTGPLTGL